MKKFGGELAQQLIERIASPEVRQLLADTKAANDTDTGTFEVVITTENLDRYQEVIKLDGWELEHYRNNPIVLWGHDHNQPIGVATSVEIIDGKMVARGKFAPNAKGQEVRGLYDMGIIRATSVGFIEKERDGNLITKAELLEFSFVSVPANPYALSLAFEKGLSVDALVTKGLMFVEKAQEPEIAPEEAEEAPVEPEVEETTEEPEE
ncbi:MAG TPA: HK97 family phage prohead protease, partial [Archangium sp.]